MNKVNSGSNTSSNNSSQQNNQQNTQQNNNQQNNQSSGGVNIVHIGDGSNDNGYDGRYDQGSPNYAGSSTGNNTTKPNSTVTTKPNTNTSTNTNTTTKPNTNTNITTKPNTNTNTNTNNNVVTKPSTGGTSKPVGQRVPLDTTGDYDDIVLTGSDRNDIVMMNINNNKDNLLSTLTGYEEPLRAAVGIFNAHKYEDLEALNKYYYNGKTNSNLVGDSMKYVAYKIVEYHKFSQQETDEVEKSARITMGIDDSSEITGYYRITMRVYQSKNRKINIIKDETRDPFYFTVTLIEVDGTPYEYISLTRR